MKQIPLTQGKFALVDDDDFERVVRHRWFAHNVRGKWYAENRSLGGMHTMIMGSEKIDQDHIDGDGLNNQKHNLRPCNDSQNQMNRSANKNNKTGFKGVYPRPDNTSRPWAAGITVNKERYHIGYFITALEAAHAYDEAAKKYHGVFARLNFP